MFRDGLEREFLQRMLTANAWAVGERQADGRLRPLLVCDDQEIAIELTKDLCRLGREVEAVEIEEKVPATHP